MIGSDLMDKRVDCTLVALYLMTTYRLVISKLSTKDFYIGELKYVAGIEPVQ